MGNTAVYHQGDTHTLWALFQTKFQGTKEENSSA